MITLEKLLSRGDIPALFVSKNRFYFFVFYEKRVFEIIFEKDSEEWYIKKLGEKTK
jgi:hypothetical protein